MKGDAKRRYCDHCQLHVHNLSAMPVQQQEQLVEETGGKACIAYELRPNGSVITWSRWRWLLRPFQRAQWAAVTLFATLLPFLFSSCTTRRMLGSPVAPRDTRQTDMVKGRRQMVPGTMMAPPSILKKD